MQRFTPIFALAGIGLAMWFFVYRTPSGTSPFARSSTSSATESLNADDFTHQELIGASDRSQAPPRDEQTRRFQHGVAKIVQRVTASRSTLDDTMSEDDDGDAEDEEIQADSNVPEQRIWRATWLNEKPDPVWTQEMAKEITAKAQLLVKGDLDMHGLSCRETVCRMYLRFSEQSDAQAIIASDHDASRRYEYQALSPLIEEEDHPNARHEFEVLIVREKPEVITENANAESSVNHAEFAKDDDRSEANLPQVNADAEKLITIVSRTSKR